jgi:hypothetical protein
MSEIARYDETHPKVTRNEDYRVTRESDIQEILGVPNRYIDGVNRRDLDVMVSVYSQDARFQIPFLGADVRGRENIREYVSKRDPFAHPDDFFSQQIGAQRLVRYTHEVANVYTHYQGFNWNIDGSGFHYFMVYDDEMTRNGDKWEITDRIGHSLFRATIAPTGSAFPCPPMRELS